MIPTHWRIFAIAWLILAARLRRDRQCGPASDAERNVCKSAFQRERITGLIAHFGSLHLGFRFSSNRSPYLFESSVAVLSHLLQDSFRTFPDPTGFLTFARLFLGQRRGRIALPLGKCRAGRLPLFPAVASACQARFGRPRPCLAPRFPQSLQSFAVTPKSLWLTNQNPEPSNSRSISLPMPSGGLNRSTSRWDSRQKLKRSRQFSIFSTKDKIDPATLQRMEKKIDHSIHLLESLT